MRRVFIVIIVLFASGGYTQEVEVRLKNQTNRTAHILSSTGDTLSVRVWADKGTVRGLKKEDFILTEGADTAQILNFRELTTGSTADVAFTFVLDNSGSMFSAYDSLTKYLDEFIDLIGDGATANIITFDNVERKPTYERSYRNRIFLALSGFTEDKQEMKDFWHFYDSIRSDFSPLYDGVTSGLQAIRDRRNKGDVARRDIVMVVTDGFDNASSTSLSELEELAEAMQITLYTVSYRSEPDRKLAWLVKKTGGRHYDAGSIRHLAASLRDLRKMFTTAYRMVYSFPVKGAGKR